MSATVRDEPAESRYVVEVDDAAAGQTDCHLHEQTIAFLHTEIGAAFGGQGLASQLIGFALDDARGRGLSVEPFCSFVRGYIVKHPEYAELVRPEQRGRFGL